MDVLPDSPMPIKLWYENVLPTQVPCLPPPAQKIRWKLMDIDMKRVTESYLTYTLCKADVEKNSKYAASHLLRSLLLPVFVSYFRCFL